MVDSWPNNLLLDEGTMRKKWIFATCAGGTLLLAICPWFYFAVAQPDVARARQEEVGAKAADGPLPVRQVVLFNTGVGYFQHEGQVDGTPRVELPFPAYDMNDLLKSLILQDGGGAN